MRLQTWDPLRGFDSLFNQYGFGRDFSLAPMTDTQWTPAVDISENDEAFYLKVELPEMKKEDVKVEVNEGILTLTGERHKEETDQKEHRVERFYGQFTRSFTLPDNILGESIDAEFKDGMLYLTLPKIEVEAHKPLAIDIH